MWVISPFLAWIQSILIVHYLMDRVQQLAEVELSRPRRYSQLKDSPFPYLLESNRFEIFEFIREIESENQRLAEQVTARFPSKTLEECMQEHRLLQAKRRLVEINQGSIEKMEMEIREKMGESERLRMENQELEAVRAGLSAELEEVEGRVVEAEKERRTLEMKVRLQQEREAGRVDLSSIFHNLYKEVKETLNSSL